MPHKIRYNPKQLNGRICVAPKLRKFSELFVRKAPLTPTERGENFGLFPALFVLSLRNSLTHVMVANPTEGYGIFIENMLNAAQ